MNQSRSQKQIKRKKRIQKRQQQRKKKSRQRGLRGCLPSLVIVMCLLLIIIGGGIFLWKNIDRLSSDNPVSLSGTVRSLILKDSEPTEESVRKVQNTATEDHHKTNGLAICMYHYIYDADNPPEELNNNYIEISDLKEELQYLIDEEYFFPTWEEVRQYIDGELLLPEKSIVLTFDDGAKDTLKFLKPLSEKYQIPITSFLITKNNGEKKVETYTTDYLTFQSHSDSMHQAGGYIGHGGIFTAMTHDDAVADLQKSIDICGNGDAFAYPYGDYSDSCVLAVQDAEFLCAVTTEYGRCYPGDDPLLLPRMRMTKDQTLENFIEMVE